MNQEPVILGLALLALWYLRTRDQAKQAAAAPAAAPITIDAAPTIVNEDRSGEAIASLFRQWAQQNPDNRISLTYKGDAGVIVYDQRPAYEAPTYYGRGPRDGTPTFYYP